MRRNGLNVAKGLLLLQESMPSWLYPIRHGATTMWERWDSRTDGQGPARLCIGPSRSPSNMNSINHYAYPPTAWCGRTSSDRLTRNAAAKRRRMRGFSAAFLVD